MKTIKKLGLALSLAFVTILSSCGGDDNNGESTIAVPATGTYINAKVDGANFTTVIAGQSVGNASIIGTGANSIITVLGNSVGQITGTTFSSSTISLVLQGITSPGTYPINTDSDSVLTYIFTPSSTSGESIAYITGDCAGSTGTVTITTLSATKVEGTFSFTAKKEETCDGTKTITSGSFRGMFQ